MDDLLNFDDFSSLITLRYKLTTDRFMVEPIIKSNQTIYPVHD